MQKKRGQVEMFQINETKRSDFFFFFFPPQHQAEISLPAFRVWEALKSFCRELY